VGQLVVDEVALLLDLGCEEFPLFQVYGGCHLAEAYFGLFLSIWRGGVHQFRQVEDQVLQNVEQVVEGGVVS